MSDRFRKAEFEQALAEAGIGAVLCDGPKLDPHKAEKEADKVDDGRWPMCLSACRRAGPDGAMDVRAFQVEVLRESHLKTWQPSLMLEKCYHGKSLVDHIRTATRTWTRRVTRSRIDALQAAVLAVGAGRRWRKPASGRGAGSRSTWAALPGGPDTA